jgi:glycosyltransferase involved in cell wall biosynthesis
MLVSVIIPYNKDRGYLQAALESIERQTYKNYEIILSQSSKTVGYNFNQAVKQAVGDYICYLAEDDLLTVDSLENRVRCLLHSDYDFIHSRGKRLYKNGTTKPYNLTNPATTLKEMLQVNTICGGTTMYNSSIFDSVLFDETLTTAEEYDFHLNLLSKGYSLGFLDEVTYTLRQHRDQKSIGNTTTEYQDKRKQIIKEIQNRYEEGSSICHNRR